MVESFAHLHALPQFVSIFALECQLMRKSDNSISLQHNNNSSFFSLPLLFENSAHFVEEMKRNVSKCAKDVTNTATLADIDADKYTETDADIDTAFTCILQQLTALCALSLLHFSGLVFHIVYSGFFPLSLAINLTFLVAFSPSF